MQIGRPNKKEITLELASFLEATEDLYRTTDLNEMIKKTKQKCTNKFGTRTQMENHPCNLTPAYRYVSNANPMGFLAIFFKNIFYLICVLFIYSIDQ